MNVLLDHLIALYGDDVGKSAFESLRDLVTRYASRLPPARAAQLSQRDAILITYGDQVRSQDEAPLRTLGQFAERHLRGVVSGIHLLPFYPYSSDDGFSVIDYRAVDAALGDWQDVEDIGRDFRLMFDAVLNHVSVSSEWFRRFLQDDPRYRDFFIVVPEGAGVSRVIRPRALPLVTPFTTPSGEKRVWTTFSADQVDLNYHNPDVLLE
ncbi:MAG TPA: alpha-amylase family glycosyl hydrolase, partial [Anaerolineae bacterium]